MEKLSKLEREAKRKFSIVCYRDGSFQVVKKCLFGLLHTSNYKVYKIYFTESNNRFYSLEKAKEHLKKVRGLYIYECEEYEKNKVIENY